MLTLALALAITQAPQHRLFLQPNLSASADFAFFEAFSNGAGTFGVCSTTPPTGAKGEPLTFARASTATCTKTGSGGLATTGIANGDLVTMSSGQPRVEYDSAGTLGLLVESSRINSLLRSEELNNPAWTADVGVTVTADAAQGPTAATVAERIQYAGGGGATLNRVFQFLAMGGTLTHSVFVRGNGTSGTIWVWDDGSATSAVACSYVSGSWSRCTATASSGGSAYIAFGCRASFLGMPATCPANDVFAFGVQSETGAYATSYIPTTSAAVTRVAETASFPVVINTTNGVSHAHSFTLEGVNNFQGSMSLYQDALNRTQLYQYSTNAFGADYFSTSGNRAASNVPGFWAAGTTYRIAMSYSGAGAASTVSSYLGGVLQNTGAAGITSAWTSSVLGFALSSPFAGTDAIHSRLCADPLNARCR